MGERLSESKEKVVMSVLNTKPFAEVLRPEELRAGGWFGNNWNLSYLKSFDLVCLNREKRRYGIAFVVKEFDIPAAYFQVMDDMNQAGRFSRSFLTHLQNDACRLVSGGHRFEVYFIFVVTNFLSPPSIRWDSTDHSEESWELFFGKRSGIAERA